MCCKKLILKNGCLNMNRNITVNFNIPEEISHGLASGKYKRIGGVIYDNEGCEIKAWLRESPSITKDSFQKTPINSLSNSLGMANLATNIINLGATIYYGEKTISAIKEVDGKIDNLTKITISGFNGVVSRLCDIKNDINSLHELHRSSYLSRVDSVISRLKSLEYNHSEDMKNRICNECYPVLIEVLSQEEIFLTNELSKAKSLTLDLCKSVMSYLSLCDITNKVAYEAVGSTRFVLDIARRRNTKDILAALNDRFFSEENTVKSIAALFLDGENSKKSSDYLRKITTGKTYDQVKDFIFFHDCYTLRLHEIITNKHVDKDSLNLSSMRDIIPEAINDCRSYIKLTYGNLNDLYSGQSLYIDSKMDAIIKMKSMLASYFLGVIKNDTNSRKSFLSMASGFTNAIKEAGDLFDHKNKNKNKSFNVVTYELRIAGDEVNEVYDRYKGNILEMEYCEKNNIDLRECNLLFEKALSKKKDSFDMALITLQPL